MLILKIYNYHFLPIIYFNVTVEFFTTKLIFLVFINHENYE